MVNKKITKLSIKISENIIKRENLNYEKWILLNDNDLKIIVSKYVRYSRNPTLFDLVVGWINSEYDI